MKTNLLFVSLLLISNRPCTDFFLSFVLFQCKILLVLERLKNIQANRVIVCIVKKYYLGSVVCGVEYNNAEEQVHINLISIRMNGGKFVYISGQNRSYRQSVLSVQKLHTSSSILQKVIQSN